MRDFRLPKEYTTIFVDELTPNIVFVGYNKIGADVGLNNWIVQKIDNTTSTLYTIITYAEGSWTNKEFLNYK